jgi:hypothetical protein
MADLPDAWYVRLPNGRILRAPSTAALRHHLRSGHIPLESRVRRSPEEAWARLRGLLEFADLLEAPARKQSPPPPRRRPPEANYRTPRPAPRPNRRPAQAVSVRGCVDELLGALDRTLARPRLLGAAAVGLVSAAVLLVVRHFPLGQDWWAPLPWVAAGVASLVVCALYAALVAQTIFIELSQLRPARRDEIVAGLVRNWLRLTVAWLLVAGLCGGLLAGLHWLEGWVRAEEPAGVEVLTGAIVSLRLVIEVVAWPLLGLALLLAPTIVVEECSPLRALGQWLGLLRRKLKRVFVYETLAAALGGITSLPLVFPVALAVGSWSGEAALNPVVEGTLAVLCGLALAPLLAYLAVSNVYVYLNVRYEREPQG